MVQAANARAGNGISLEELHARLTAERPTRMDAIVRTDQHVEMVPLAPRQVGRSLVADVGVLFNTRGSDLSALDGQVAGLTPYMHGQVAARSGIPKAYYDRMRATQPELLVRNVETWWKSEPEKRMARLVQPATVEGGRLRLGDLTGRAWLSDRYRTLDNLDFVLTVLEAAYKYEACVEAAHLDDERVYLKLLSPRLRADIKRGDVLEAGVIVKNSEVGDGRVLVQPFFKRLICMNGMVGTEQYGQVHLGGENDVGILKQDTLAAEARSVWLQVRDWVVAVLEGHFLEQTVAQFRRAEGVHVPADVPAKRAVATVVRNFGLTGGDGEGILERYLRNGSDTMFGMVNAVTQYAHEGGNDFRRQVELEQYAGRLLATESRQFLHLLSTPLTDEQVSKAVSAN